MCVCAFWLPNVFAFVVFDVCVGRFAFFFVVCVVCGVGVLGVVLVMRFGVCVLCLFVWRVLFVLFAFVLFVVLSWLCVCFRMLLFRFVIHC